MSDIDLTNHEDVDRFREQTEMDIRTGIVRLQQLVHQTAVAHGWWEDGERNMGEMIALMHSELSEALESHRDSEPYLWYQHNLGPDMPGGSDVVSVPGSALSTMPVSVSGNIGKPEGIASEFADTIIRICDTCERLGIPLAEAIIRKAAYNETRPYRHGGKKA